MFKAERDSAFVSNQGRQVTDVHLVCLKVGIMELKTCRMCGKLYNYIGRTTPVCPNCMKALDEKFELCKKYIKENPGANIQKVSENTEVSVKTIKNWVREERLSFADGSMVGIECESCGANILTGRFCVKCKQQLANGLSNSIKPQAKPQPQEKKKDSAKMRFLDE